MVKRKHDESVQDGNGRVTQGQKIQVTRRINAKLWERLQAYADSLDPPVTDTAVVESALRHYLDEREKK